MSSTKLLIVCSRTFPIVEPLRRAFAKHDVEVSWFDYHRIHWFDRYVIHPLNKQAHNLRLLPKGESFFADHPLAHLHFRGTLLLERLAGEKPHFVLMVRGLRFTEQVLERAARGARLFGWHIESDEHALEVIPEARYFGRYYFISPASVEKARAAGVSHAALLRHSLDIATRFPVPGEKRFDWCFVGNWTARRQQLLEVALTVSPRGVIYGGGWRRKNAFHPAMRRLVQGKYISGAPLNALYSATKIVLNITAWGHGDGSQRSGVNMRVLEVPACRTALLTDRSADLEALVRPGEHVIVYESDREFGSQLQRYLADEPERERIARSGYAHVVQTYSYEDVARVLLEDFQATRPLDRRACSA